MPPSYSLNSTLCPAVVALPGFWTLFAPSCWLVVEAEKSLFEFASVIIGGHRLALVDWERARRARKCERPTCTRVQMVVVVVRMVMVMMLMTVMMIIMKMMMNATEMHHGVDQPDARCQVPKRQAEPKGVSKK